MKVRGIREEGSILIRSWKGVTDFLLKDGYGSVRAGEITGREGRRGGINDGFSRDPDESRGIITHGE